MNYDVVKAEYVGGHRLKIEFSDGKSGVVDFMPYIEKGGVFEQVRGIEQFKLFAVDADWKTITWQDGEIDFAPETLYFIATGEWPGCKPAMQVAEEPPDYDSSSS